jgi:hypothetical protein
VAQYQLNLLVVAVAVLMPEVLVELVVTQEDLAVVVVPMGLVQHQRLDLEILLVLVQVRVILVGMVVVMRTVIVNTLLVEVVAQEPQAAMQ